MMKRFIRRVTAFALSAMLLTAPMAQAQELMTPEGTWLSVEIVVTLGDGSQFSLDVTPVTTTLGSTKGTVTTPRSRSRPGKARR